MFSKTERRSVFQRETDIARASNFNVKSMPVKYSETCQLPSERKTYTNTLQFKSFWGCRDLFSKRSRVVPRKHGVTGKPLCQKGFPRYHLLPSSPFPRFPASFSPRRQKQTDFSTVLLPFSHRPRCIISAKDRALPSPREKKKGRTRK